MKYKLNGGPSGGVVVQLPVGAAPVERFLYFQGQVYWVEKIYADEKGYINLIWDGHFER